MLSSSTKHELWSGPAALRSAADVDWENIREKQCSETIEVETARLSWERDKTKAKTEYRDFLTFCPFLGRVLRHTSREQAIW